MNVAALLLIIVIIIIVIILWNHHFKNNCLPKTSYLASQGYQYYNGTQCVPATDNLAVKWIVDNRSSKYIYMQMLAQTAPVFSGCQYLEMILPGAVANTISRYQDYILKGAYPTLYKNCTVYFVNGSTYGQLGYANSMTLSNVNGGDTVLFTVIDDSSSNNGISATYRVI